MSGSRRRARRADSIATGVEVLLGEYQKPVPTEALRVIIGDRRGQPVSAEQLSRLSAYEREEFLSSLLPPRLCSVIDARAEAPTPRWWARGDWRLQRRIITEESEPTWRAHLATRLCREMARRREAAGSPMTTLALASVARVIGPVDTYTPVSPEGWRHFELKVAEVSAPHGLDAPTLDQSEAEARLLEDELPAVALYFGRKWADDVGDKPDRASRSKSR